MISGLGAAPSKIVQLSSETGLCTMERAHDLTFVHLAIAAKKQRCTQHLEKQKLQKSFEGCSKIDFGLKRGACEMHDKHTSQHPKSSDLQK